MTKISARNYRKHYILHLLPSVTKNGETPYITTTEEAAVWSKWLRSLARQVITEPILLRNVNLRAEQIQKYGGAVATLQTVVLPLPQAALPYPQVFLDLNYAVTKEVQLFIGGVDVTALVATSDKLTGLVTRLMKEIYDGYEEYYFGGTRDPFIEELFLVDDVEMVLDEKSSFKVRVDRSLRDYLVDLNSRLRI